MFKFLIFIALASSVYSAIVPSQVDNSANNHSTKKIDDALGLPPTQHNFPTFPEYDPSTYPAGSSYNTYALLPVVTPRPTTSSWSSTIASGLVPLGSFALTYGGRAVLFIFQLFILMVIGVILTTSMCAFTPFCTITFEGFGLTRNQVKEQVSELARSYMTPENLDIAAMLVETAVNTYGKMNRQKQQERATEEKATTVGTQQRRRRRR